jgi:DNA-directed RNA polymerase
METQGKDHDFVLDEMNKAALYVAKKTLAALEESFEGAKKLQEWMNMTALLIAKSQGATHVPKEELIRAAVIKRLGLYSGARPIGPEDVALLAAEEELERERARDEGEEEEQDFDARRRFRTLDLESESLSQPVAWTSPIGLPVMQPYRSMGTVKIRTGLADINVVDSTKPGVVNARKQSTAFPPNFVHSLDASHMFYTAVAMKREGLGFAAVHDSFWTHASDVSAMGRIIREEFVRLHENGDVLTNLRNEFIARYSNQRLQKVLLMTKDQAVSVEREIARVLGTKETVVRRKTGGKLNPKGINVAPEGMAPEFEMEVWLELDIPELPKRGSFDIREVMESPYFFH